MEKIPTLFARDETFKVTENSRPECGWVFHGEGTPTEKLDGMNIRITVRSGQGVRVEKRRNPTEIQKKQGIVDGWYMDADARAPEDRWIHEAVANTDLSTWPDGEHSCEALGPNIQGNPLGLEKHTCVPFNMAIPIYESIPRNFSGLKLFLQSLESKFAPGHLAEGIVFHHPDGRRAKINERTFLSSGPYFPHGPAAF